MQFHELLLKRPNFLRGCFGGLCEPTLVLHLRPLRFATDDIQDLERLWLQAVNGFRPEQPLYGIGDHDWPSGFLWPAEKKEQATVPLEHHGHWRKSEWLLALTVAIQRWAHQPVWRGRVLAATEQGIWMALPWFKKTTCMEALQFAHELLWHWSQTPTDTNKSLEIRARFLKWLPNQQAQGYAPNTSRFVMAAHARQIPVELMPGFVRLGWGVKAERFDSSFTGRTSNIATRTAKNKKQTSMVLAAAGLPVPASALVPTAEHACKVAVQLGWPVVVKPVSLDQGQGVVAGINDEASLLRAFAAAEKLSRGNVMLEKHVDGADHRMLVVNGKLMMTTRRVPPGVTGNGLHTVKQLMDEVNTDPRRGTEKRSLLIKLKEDESAMHCLAEQGLELSCKPAAGRFVYLSKTANISTGGTAIDVSSAVHPDNRVLAERAALAVGLDIAGVDFLCPDITRSWMDVGGAICEVNAQPGLRVHWLTAPERDINAEILDRLFGGSDLRIPTAAITGTNGKTTVSKMLHHIWQATGKCCGVTTTSGTWIGDAMVGRENLSGLPGAKLLLGDPSVEAAVLEMPRKGLAIFGQATDRYDVAALTNVQDDHLGTLGVETLDQMALLKSRVLEQATGAIVVNADDERCMAVRHRSRCKRHILVSRNENNAALKHHLSQGGEAVFLIQSDRINWICLAKGDSTSRLMATESIPATMQGLLEFNETNAMFAVAIAWAQKIELDVIVKALKSFKNNEAQNPGRYNFVEGLPFKLMLDYAHNPNGAIEVARIASSMKVDGRKRLMCMNIGNRHKHHIDQSVQALASSFDSIIISGDKERVMASADWHTEGTKENAYSNMLAYFESNILRVGFDKNELQIEPDPSLACLRILKKSKPNDLVIILGEASDLMPVIRAYLKEIDAPEIFN